MNFGLRCVFVEMFEVKNNLLIDYVLVECKNDIINWILIL